MTELTAGTVFLDSAYAIALINEADALHAIALSLAAELQTRRIKFVTTRAILLEIGDALSKPRYRLAAAELLASIDRDPDVEIVEIDRNLYSEAFNLYLDRPDKGWGLTDCLSFRVMLARGLREALTHDTHFEQAGFRALMRSEP